MLLLDVSCPSGVADRDPRHIYNFGLSACALPLFLLPRALIPPPTQAPPLSTSLPLPLTTTTWMLTHSSPIMYQYCLILPSVVSRGNPMQPHHNPRPWHRQSSSSSHLPLLCQTGLEFVSVMDTE